MRLLMPRPAGLLLSSGPQAKASYSKAFYAHEPYPTAMDFNGSGFRLSARPDASKALLEVGMDDTG